MTKEQKREKWRDEEKEEEEKESIRRSERHFRTKRERENGMKTETKQHILAVIFFTTISVFFLALGIILSQFFLSCLAFLFIAASKSISAGSIFLAVLFSF